MIVSEHKVVFNKPPENIPNRVSIDAPLMGNGDILVAFAGTPDNPQFWLDKNDLWLLKSSQPGTSPVPGSKKQTFTKMGLLTLLYVKYSLFKTAKAP